MRCDSTYPKKLEYEMSRIISFVLFSIYDEVYEYIIDKVTGYLVDFITFVKYMESDIL